MSDKTVTLKEEDVLELLRWSEDARYNLEILAASPIPFDIRQRLHNLAGRYPKWADLRS